MRARVREPLGLGGGKVHGRGVSRARAARAHRQLLRGVKCYPPMWGGDTDAPANVHALIGAELAIDGPLHVFKDQASNMWDAMFEMLTTADRAQLCSRISGLLNGHEVSEHTS